MISFIVIGRNEGWKLTKCFESIIKTIAYNHLEHYEIIYVDSISKDDSIERVRDFKNTKIFQLKGDCNAAIARNVGAKESKGDVLFFIDGDMEIIPNQFRYFYTESDGLTYSFVTGNWYNYYYNQNWKFLKKDSVSMKVKDTKESTTGGLFLIERSIWNLVGGMRNEFERSQDIDFALRLAKKNILLLKKKEVLAHHHTISYLDKHRMWKDLFSSNHLYGRSLLYRKNILNKYVYKRIITNDYSLLILIITVILAFAHNSYLYVYIVLILLKSLKKGKLSIIACLNFFLYYFLRDASSLMGLIIFLPKAEKKIDYNKIQ